MSERMTDEALFRGASRAADDADPSGDDMEKRGFARAQFWREEAMRARASEVEKDAVIKALANALWDARQYGDEAEDLCWCMAPCFSTAWRNPKCEGKVATLRIAGRL